MGKSHDPLLSKLPPQSTEAEAWLFSAILFDNKIIDDILEILTPLDFYKTAHQKLFAAMLDLFENKDPVDLVSLANRLADQGLLEEVGGAGYLARLVDQVR